ncbi:MAG: hypothetical protein ABIT83_05785 [Massilia sp.]
MQTLSQYGCKEMQACDAKDGRKGGSEVEREGGAKVARRWRESAREEANSGRLPREAGREMREVIY